MDPRSASFSLAKRRKNPTWQLVPTTINFRINTPNIPPKLKEYLNEARAPLPPLTDPDEPLQIDSVGLMRLVAFMEKELGVWVQNHELLAENFATLRTLDELMATKKPQPPGGDAGSAA